MKPIPSTYEVLAWKCLNRNIDEAWINWAVEMMLVGFEGENLIALAGISKPYDQFELTMLTDKVFGELGLDYSDKERVIQNYVSYLFIETLDKKRSLKKTIETVGKLHLDLHYESPYIDFYHLKYARLDLEHSEAQFYWEGANRQNIDAVCTEVIQEWLARNASFNEKLFEF